MKLRNGIWVALNEKPSDMAQNGVPRTGEIVEVNYFSTPSNPSGCKRIASKVENVDVLKAKQTGMTIFFSAE
jgi:hypothetical protein